MSLTKENKKLEIEERDDNRYSDYEWIGHSESFNEGDPLFDRRKELIVIGRIGDNDSCYSYDDYALVRLDDKYYLLHTSGCSCPSPTETAGTVEGPLSLEEMEDKIESSIKNDTWGNVHDQADEFRELIAFAKEVA